MNRNILSGIKKPGWVYLFRTHGFTEKKKPIYKLGRTTRENPFKRFNEFSGANRLKKLLYCNYFSDIQIETNVLKQMRTERSIIHLEHIGLEYFSCSDDSIITDMIKLLVSEIEFKKDTILKK